MVKSSTAHLRAREKFQSRRRNKCSICKEYGKAYIHHIDGNWNNNKLSNLKEICPSCHLKTHRPKNTCSICKAPVKGHGLCRKHYYKFVEYGDPLAYPDRKRTLTGDVVRRIRIELKTNGRKDVAEKFCVSYSVVRSIHIDQCYRDIR